MATRKTTTRKTTTRKTTTGKTTTGKTTARKSAAPHLRISALPGTGKTTTIIDGLNRLFGCDPEVAKGTAEQKQIWKAMLSGAESVADIRLNAFSRDIAKELQERMPAPSDPFAKETVEASTFHSFGLRSIRKSIRGVHVPRKPHYVDWNRAERALQADTLPEGVPSRLAGMTAVDLFKSEDATVLRSSLKLVSMLKQTLTDWNDTESVYDLMLHYGIESNGSRDAIIGLSAAIMELSLFPEHNGKEINFDDMCWLPVARNLPLEQVDLLLIDESQDLNRCRQELAIRSVQDGGRIIFVGDENQAIFGFAGADVDSMQRLSAVLSESNRGLREYRLTTTFRCGKAIVEHARQWIPEYKAYSGNHEGEVMHIDGGDAATVQSIKANDKPADTMVLCRLNAPLVALYYKLLSQRIPAYIMGRDIGAGLLEAIKKSKTSTVVDFLVWLDEWQDSEQQKIMSRKNPSAAALAGLQDKVACLEIFAAQCSTVKEMQELIEANFADKGEGVRLSSIHKSKGLESPTVYVIRPDLLPFFAARLPWEKEQERNLQVVAATRAINRLVYVAGNEDDAKNQ